jgi:hypothetical protein
MIDEDAVELEARLIAIEHVVANLYGMVCRSVGATPQMIEATLSAFQERIRNETFEGVDPAQSDLLAAALEDAFGKLIAQMRAIALAKSA